MRIQVLNTKHLIPIIILGGLCLLSACTHYYYAPNDSANLPIREKNDIQAAAGIGMSPFVNPGTSISVQGAYSPINHLSIQCGYFSTSFKGNILDSLAEGRISMWSAAIGGYYFLDFDEEVKNDYYAVFNTRRGMLFDGYIGYDKGRAFNQYTRSGTSSLKFDKKFVQLGTHYIGEVLGLDASLKVGVLDYTKAKLRGNVSELRLSEVEAVIANDTYTFCELGLRMSIGVRYGKMYVGYTEFFAAYPEEIVNFKESIFQVGYIVSFDEIFRKKKPEPRTFPDDQN